MNAKFSPKIPWIALILFCLAYVLLGWYLSAYNIVWLVGIFVTSVIFSGAWKSSPLLERLVRFCSQGLFVLLFIALILSIFIALAAIWSILLTFLVIPLATTLLAEVEMRFSGFSKLDTFLVFTVLAAVGLALGEIIEIVILPSGI